MTSPNSREVFDTAATAVGGQRTVEVVFVDLDQSLIATDLYVELLLSALKRQPRLFLSFPRWMSQGHAAVKHQLAKRLSLDIPRLPYRPEVLAYLQEQQLKGCRLVLATASDETPARQVADHLGIFDAVLASDGQRNLKGHAKLAAMEEYCRKHQFTQFAYVGDCASDLPIWQAAAEVVAVGPSAKVTRHLQALDKPVRLIPRTSSRLAALGRVIRPKQWVKNLLLFAPLILAHHLVVVEEWLRALLAFVAFSACASATYVLNDLLDVDADRDHPIKRSRPFASGTLPGVWGPPLALALFLGGLSLSVATLPNEFSALLGFYVVTTLLYSFWLKQKVMIDVIVLAGLYTLRIVAGGAAIDVAVSEWFMALSLFLCTSLAFGKRYCELLEIEHATSPGSRGRGYEVGDLSLIEVLGPTSGYIAVLVLALYIHSDTAGRLYANGRVLWLICPLLMYWISRYWIMAKRRFISEDPITFALRDRVSRIVGVLIVAVALAATWSW